MSNYDTFCLIIAHLLFAEQPQSCDDFCVIIALCRTALIMYFRGHILNILEYTSEYTEYTCRMEFHLVFCVKRIRAVACFLLVVLSHFQI